MDTGLRRYDDVGALTTPLCHRHAYARDDKDRTKTHRHPDAGRGPLCSCTMDTGLRRYDDVGALTTPPLSLRGNAVPAAIQ